MSSSRVVDDAPDALPMKQFVPSDNTSQEEKSVESGHVEEKRPVAHRGQAKFKNLSWVQLTTCLIVEAIALGSLSLPRAFADLGMVLGVILTVFLGMLAMYTSYVIGQVKLKYDHVKDYADAVELIWGRFGYWLTATMFVLFLVLLVGSHVLTGTIAWIRITDATGVCALVFSVVSVIILFACAIPPSFHEFAILGYIDFVSIILAIGVTMIATGIRAHQEVGGLSAVNWSLWPPADITFSSAFLSVTNIVFAYSFAICQFSFMDELHTVTDFPKAIYCLGTIEIVIYTLTGAIIYAFVGNDVQSPALLSAGFVMSRIVFGLGLPVIFISGSINSTVSARYIVQTLFKKGSDIYYTTGRAGWTIWLLILVIQTVVAFVVANAIPFFGDLLGIISALFSSGFSFYFPALFWFQLIKEGNWNKDWRNICLSLLNGLCFLVGIVVLGAGTYASVQDIINNYNSGTVRSPFTCNSNSYL